MRKRILINIGKISIFFVLVIAIFFLNRDLKFEDDTYRNYISIGGLLMEDCDGINCNFMIFQHAIADRFWINSLQYLGSNIYADYVEGLNVRIRDINILDTYREFPYVFSQIILPQNSEQNPQSWKDAISVGERGVSRFCDMEKAEYIWNLEERELLDMYNDENDFWVCESYLLPASLAFVYFYHAGDIENAINHYKIASFSPDAPANMINMPAILKGRYSSHRQSMLAWYYRYLSAFGQLNPELDHETLIRFLDIAESALDRAANSIILDMIQEVDEVYGCNKNIDCVMVYYYAYVVDILDNCDIENDEIFCEIGKYAINRGYINKDEIHHPIIENGEYMYREDRNSWGWK